MTTAYLLSNKPLNFENIPRELADSYSIDKTLHILGFREELGILKRSWGPLEVSAGPWLSCWHLTFSTNWRSEDIIPIPYHLAIPPKQRPIVILSMIHEAWNTWFNWLETPAELQMGKEFGERNWAEQLKEYLNRPTLWADREFFRFCVSYLDKLFDWPAESEIVQLSYTDGQLKLKIKDYEVHCPARGNFNGTLTLSARQFFRYLPKRFIGETVIIQVAPENKVVIGTILLNCQFQAHGSEKASLHEPIEKS